MQVVAFTGKRFSGKSTASEVLLQEGFVDVKFADPLKNMLRAFYKTCGVSDEDIERRLEGDLKEVPCEWLKGKTPRYAMQTLGTEWRNMIDTNLWSDILVRRIKSGDVGDKIVVSDYRFPHEGEALREVSAKICRISRKSADDNADSAAKHASETLLDGLSVDGVIYNNDTKEALYARVKEFIKE